MSLNAKQTTEHFQSMAFFFLQSDDWPIICLSLTAYCLQRVYAGVDTPH